MGKPWMVNVEIVGSAKATRIIFDYVCRSLQLAWRNCNDPVFGITTSGAGRTVLEVRWFFPRLHTIFPTLRILAFNDSLKYF